MRRIYKVALNVIAMGMRDRLFKRRQSIDENMTGCLQRYVIFQHERTMKYLISNTNNIVLQIIPRKHDFDFHCRRGEICRTNPPDKPFKSHAFKFQAKRMFADQRWFDSFGDKLLHLAQCKHHICQESAVS
jgi:hypothetical protein